MEMQLHRERCVLLMIDIQEKLAPAMPEAVLHKTVRNAKILLEAARRMEIPVVVSEQYPKGLGETLPQLRDSLKEIDQLSRLEKLSFSVCGADAFGDIQTRYSDAGRNQWIVLGMETHICVYQTARSLRASGAAVHVPVDAVASRSKQNYQVGLGLIERAGGYLSSTETIVMDVLGCASGDDFKAISKLIR